MERDNLVGAGGKWPVIDEKPDPSVVRQTFDASCVSACGEMLLRDCGIGGLSQADLMEQLGAPAVTLELAGVLNQRSGVERWRSAQVNVPDMGGRNAVEALGDLGSWVAEFREVGVRIGHAVVVDGLKDNTLRIRDPFDGTSYTMKLDDFLEYWSWTAVWQERP